MLTITVPEMQFWDEDNEQFIHYDTVTLELEHSLVALSKWEEIFEKPYLGPAEKTMEETLAYLECMIVTPDFPPGVSRRFTRENFDVINEYINAKKTATWFSEDPSKPKSREIITAELIYFWMIGFNIPLEFEHWHLNKLFTLIKVCENKSQQPKKMSRAEALERQRKLNAERKAKLGTNG